MFNLEEHIFFPFYIRFQEMDPSELITFSELILVYIQGWISQRVRI